MPDVFLYLTLLAFGALLGIATLPWRHKLSPQGSVILYLLAWSCFWPYLLPLAAWQGVLAYRKAWWRYADREQAAKTGREPT